MKRLQRILKWTTIVTGAAIAVLLMANAYFVWSTGRELERRLVALREAHDPVQLADLARKPIPPEQNADMFLRRTASDLDAIQKELLALYPEHGYPTGTVAPADQERLEKVFAGYAKLMQLLEQAANCPDFDPQLDGTEPPVRFVESVIERSSKQRQVVRVARAWSALLLSKGRADDALAVQVRSLRLARHWQRQPLMIGYLVTVACEQAAMDGVNQVLQAGRVSSRARQALEAELALLDNMDGYNWALRSERAYSLTTARDIPGSGSWLMRGFANQLALGLIDLFDQYLEQGARLYAEVASHTRTVFAPRRGPNPYGAVVRLLEPSLAAIREPAERTRAMSRSLRVLSALQIREAKGGDRIPKLADLGLPADATIDPYSGGPLRVKKLPVGWMVYSVGRNLADDGGKLDGRTDIGAGPSSRDDSRKKP
jgi:hypothetical protein